MCECSATCFRFMSDDDGEENSARNKMKSFPSKRMSTMSQKKSSLKANSTFRCRLTCRCLIVSCVQLSCRNMSIFVVCVHISSVVFIRIDLMPSLTWKRNKSVRKISYCSSTHRKEKFPTSSQWELWVEKFQIDSWNISVADFASQRSRRSVIELHFLDENFSCPIQRPVDARLGKVFFCMQQMFGWAIGYRIVNATKNAEKKGK